MLPALRTTPLHGMLARNNTAARSGSTTLFEMQLEAPKSRFRKCLCACLLLGSRCRENLAFDCLDNASPGGLSSVILCISF
jgi:hypothetical protein